MFLASVGSKKQPFSLSELRGDQSCIQPSNNQHSRETNSPQLLLFTNVYFLTLTTTSPLKAIMQHPGRDTHCGTLVEICF